MSDKAPAPSVTIRPLRSRGEIRLRAAGAAFVVAIVEAIPVGPELARFLGIDPLSYAKRQMLLEVGIDPCHCATPGAKASRRATQATRGLLRLAKGALKGTRYAAILVKRGAVIITVVSSVTSGVSAYRELTAVGFAAMGEA